MTNGVPQVISFLSSFKTFFFFTLAFIVFGSAFLFLSYILPYKFILESKMVDLGGTENIFQFLVFSYIGGLLLYGFSLLCFRGWYRFLQPQLLKLFNGKQSNASNEINDVEIIVYLEQHPGVSDVYTLQLFYSLITYLLFSLSAFVTLFFGCGLYMWILIFVTLLLFALGLSADKSVNVFGGQTKDVINKTR